MQTARAEVWPKSIFKILVFVVFLAAGVLAQSPAPAASTTPYLDPLPQDTGSAGLKQELRKLQNTGRLMMVVAHPDDEDGGLLTLEARGKGVHCLLMTLTRGEGGQNKTGGTFSDELGVLRTLELLAAGRYYGVDQRFSRVADFGFSKSAEETFQKWGGHDIALADIVRVIRTFRPDVLIARFSGTPRDGHGHHQASSILTQEAFRAAADPNRFPEQIKEGLRPWQAKKLYVGNVCGFMSNTCPDENWTVKLNTGEDDPVLGMSYVQFAVEGLKHQESQGLGDIRLPSGPRYAFYKLADSVLPKTTDANGHEKDIFDGIDTRLPALPAKLGLQDQIADLHPELSKIAGEINDSPESLSKVGEALASVEDRIEESDVPAATKAPLTAELSEKTQEAERALNLALNVTLQANVSPPQGPGASVPAEKDALTHVSPGQRFEVVATLHNGSKKYWLTIHAARVDRFDWVRQSHADQVTIAPGEDYYANFLIRVPQDAPISRPYWHRDDPQTDSIYQVNPEYQTLPLPPAPLHVSIDYEIAGHKGLHSPAPDILRGKPKPPGTEAISSAVDVPFKDDQGDTRRQQLAITPAFSVVLEPSEQVIPLADDSSTSVKVGVTSNLTGVPVGALHLQLPSGWRTQPETVKVNLPKRDDEQDFSFKVFPAKVAQEKKDIHAVLEAGGKTYDEGYTLVTRQDLGSFYYFDPAIQRVSIVDVKTPKDLKLAYVMGAGDDIPTVLQQIGMDVTFLPADRVATADLSQFGTIVLGVRAYDTQKDLVANNQKLLEFVSNGGTLIVQNNNSTGDFNSEHLTPYPAELSRARVSVEEAPVQILEPGNPVFHYPNEISQKDFDGWVQERGLYFMDSWDDHFQPLLSCHDPNEPDQKGGMLEAKYGKGIYIYTGYAFFRQLPAGVPGAIRLFVNLVSAGHEASSH